MSEIFTKRNKMKGVKVSYELITVGGTVKTESTYLHDILLYDSEDREYIIQAFQIKEICGQAKSVDVSGIVSLFNNLSLDDVTRTSGPVELLIGIKHVNIHPKPIEEIDGVVLFDSIFGTNRIIAGVHSTLEENDYLNSDTEITAHAQIKNP